jgi:hypothetical protein
MRSSVGREGLGTGGHRKETLRRAYHEYLKRTGLDLAFADHAPASMASLPDPFAGGSFDPKAAAAFNRLLESSRGYSDWHSVGTEPPADYLLRLATVRRRGGPYLGDRLPHLQDELERLGGDLLDEIHHSGSKLPFDVMFGLNPTGDFNAHVEPVAGGALILMNAGTMDLLFTILKINLAASGSEQDPPKLNQEQTAMVLAEAFNAYLYGEFSLLAWPLPPLDPKREEPLAYLLRAGEGFMLAHELGHVALGHVRPPATVGGEAEVRLTPETELEADKFGVDLLIHSAALKNDDPTTQFLAGGIMNFLIVELTKSALARVFQLEQVIVGTHPALEDRFKSVGALLNERFPSAEPLKKAAMFQGWLDLQFFEPVVALLRQVDETFKRPGKYGGPFA